MAQAPGLPTIIVVQAQLLFDGTIILSWTDGHPCSAVVGLSGANKPQIPAAPPAHSQSWFQSNKRCV